MNIEDERRLKKPELQRLAGDQSVEEWEGLRRSVAMLPPGAMALRREQALSLLGTLISNSRE